MRAQAACVQPVEMEVRRAGEWGSGGGGEDGWRLVRGGQQVETGTATTTIVPTRTRYIRPPTRHRTTCTPESLRHERMTTQQVTRGNFEEALPAVQQALLACEFFSFDWCAG